MCRDSIVKTRKKLQEKLADSLVGPIHDILPNHWIDQILDALGYQYHERIFTPLIVLWAFIGQEILVTIGKS